MTRITFLKDGQEDLYNLKAAATDLLAKPRPFFAVLTLGTMGSGTFFFLAMWILVYRNVGIPCYRPVHRKPTVP